VPARARARDGAGPARAAVRGGPFSRPPGAVLSRPEIEEETNSFGDERLVPFRAPMMWAQRHASDNDVAQHPGASLQVRRRRTERDIHRLATYELIGLVAFTKRNGKRGLTRRAAPAPGLSAAIRVCDQPQITDESVRSGQREIPPRRRSLVSCRSTGNPSP
jgi:hypothetical protein